MVKRKEYMIGHYIYLLPEVVFKEALRQIPPDFRDLVVLCDIQRLAYKEIAEITGLPLGTVKSRINRGRTMFQVLIKDIA